MKIEILGVKIDNDSISEVMKKIEALLVDGKQHYIVTPNPEFLVLAQKDEVFRDILNKADIAVPDGFGLSLAAFFLKGKILQRITGNDLIIEICRSAERNGRSIFLLGGKEGIAKIAGIKIQKMFPRITIFGILDGIEISYTKNISREIINSIDIAKPDILFVALGQGKQEKFIYNNLSLLPSVKLAIGVGGAFDFLAGKQKRAPKFMQRIGMEWLYRLIREPGRWKRILNAIVVFPWLIFKEKFKK